MRSLSLTVALAVLATGVVWLCPQAAPETRPSLPPSVPPIPDAAAAHQLLNRQPGCFVPNLGQWEHPAQFVHRSGAMTVFLQDRGWTVDLSTAKQGAALQMTFEGGAGVPRIAGEKRLAGRHDYFLGDARRWRTGVPLFESVRYDELYPGIDLRLREADGVPEYDLLLQPGADLGEVCVHVEGALGLAIAGDGSLEIRTALGPLVQPVPKTWQVGRDGEHRDVACHFTILGPDRFGFAAPDWEDGTMLTIDPGLLWSTYLGASSGEVALAVAVDARGVVTVAGTTSSTDFPTTLGVHDRTHNGKADVFVSQLDPSKSGTAQLVYSTFLGGNGDEGANSLSVNSAGVVTVAGSTSSTNFPLASPFDPTYNGGQDIFVSRLDPRKAGTAQLVYSTHLGGRGHDYAQEIAVDPLGVVTIAGSTTSNVIPTTGGAFDRSANGNSDVYVARLDPGKTGAAQLVYGTYLGDFKGDGALDVAVDGSGVVTVAGFTDSPDFPTTNGAYDTRFDGQQDGFVARLDPRKVGAAQLVYSTYLGGRYAELVFAVAVDSGGVVTVSGQTQSPDFPTTPGAFDTTHNDKDDCFVTRLDPNRRGAAQLVYSTLVGGRSYDISWGMSMDSDGVVTLVGSTSSSDYPTTGNAYDRTHNSLGTNDAIVSRLDPRRSGAAQLVYSTYLGGSPNDFGFALAVDDSGVTTVVGGTFAPNFPATVGAYDTTFNSPFRFDCFVSRLDMGVPLYADVHEIEIKAGGPQQLTVNAGKAHANLRYWIFGSQTGTRPGLDLLGVHIPLNPDLYTVLAMGAVNGKELVNFRGTLDANGRATASLHLPANLPLPSGFTLHHAFVVYDPSGKLYMASNAVPVRVK